MRSRSLLVLAAVVASSVAGRLRARAEDEAPARPAPRGEAPPAAGADECGRCHTDVHSAWEASTHALTVRAADGLSLPPETWAGGEIVHGPGRTRFERRGEELWAHTTGPNGSEQAFPVTHVVGKTRMHMFLTRLADGRQQVLPAMREHAAPVWFDYTSLYFAGPGADWRVPPAVAPGDPSFWTGPVRSWDAQCSRCHVSGRSVPESGPGDPRIAHRALGLDCEACHGPAADHAAFHDQALAGKDPMLGLKRLSRRRQVDACLVCHMETEELEPGWHAGSERDLLEHLDPTLLDDPDRIDPAGRPLELVYAGVSFHVSRCAEEGALTCTTCHDPHGGPHRSAMKGEPRGDWQCAACHAEIAANPRAHTFHDPAGEGGRCVNCHMPLLSVERGHGAVTDHTISVPRPYLEGPRVARDACAWCHVGGRGAPQGAPPLSEVEIRRRHAAWWPGAQRLPAWLDAVAEARAGRHDALERLDALLADRSAPRFARATAAALLGQHSQPGRERLLAHASDADSLVRRRAASGLLDARGERAWAALGRLLADPSPAVRVHAARTLVKRPAELAADRGLLERVRRELELSARAVPDDDLRWGYVAEACRLLDLPDAELAALLSQRRLNPDDAALRARVEHLARALVR